jgi:mRNA interferase MazF
MSAVSSQADSPARGEIWLVRFNPQVGAEIEKMRPAVVLSIDAVGRLPLRIVVPVTAWASDYAHSPWMIHLRPTGGNGLAKESAADAFQVKSVSLRRFDRRLGRITPDQLDDIAQAVALCVGA